MPDADEKKPEAVTLQGKGQERRVQILGGRRKGKPGQGAGLGAGEIIGGRA